MRHHGIALPLISLLIFSGVTIGYNLNACEPKIFADPYGNDSSRRPSYFGFSVALYSPEDRERSMIIVGAPRGNSTRLADRYEDVVEAGAIYRCPIADTRCYEWRIDEETGGKIFGPHSIIKQKKDYAWLGASLKVENSTRPKIAVCAPRWRFELSRSWFMNGMCYSTTMTNASYFYRPSKRHFPLTDFHKQTIAIDRAVNYFYYGMSQAGFSLDINPENLDLAVGAPGLLHQTGSTLILAETERQNNYGALIPDVLDNKYLKLNEYFGYSIISGNFYRNERLYASGAPRSDDTLGKVYIYSFPRTSNAIINVRKIIDGKQHGEYFGYSITACDINNDGRDDLIIGAPQWSRDVDEGRIYAYVSTGHSDFKMQSIEGETPRGRFGTSVSCLGDLDFDGYADLAVGAPYERNGTVYIFNGGPSGLRESKYSQIIRADDISASLRGFGFSISEPRDVNDDGYQDLAIGAYLSGHVVLIKTNPAVTLDIKIVPTANFMLTENITSFTVSVCSSYNGAFAPETFKVKITLEIDKFHKRVIIYQNGTLYGNVYRITTVLKKGLIECLPVKSNLKKNIQNMIDPIDMTAFVVSNEENSCTNNPGINPYLTRHIDFLKLAYVLDCGSDEVCFADLRVNVTSNLGSNNVSYVIGSKENVNLSVYIENKMEPAYRAQAHVYIPLPIALARIPTECDEQHPDNEKLEVVCNVGNPLRLSKTFVVELDMSGIQYSDKLKNIEVIVTTQSKEKNFFYNMGKLTVNFERDADIAIIGKSYEDFYSFVEKDLDENYSTKFKFDHIYEIRKFGVTPIERAVLEVHVPSHWKNIEIVKLDQLQGTIDGRQCSCDNVTQEESYPSTSFMSAFDDKSFNEGNNTLIVPFEKRTIYINCTDRYTACQKFRCEFGPFLKAQSVAQLILTIDVTLSNIITNAVKEKDIIFFVSEGFIAIAQPNITIKFDNKRPDYKQISTTFLNHREPEKVALWIIILSVLLGIILLILLTLILLKLGFFNRKRKEDLDTLQSQEEENLRVTGNDNQAIAAEREFMN